MAQSPSIRASDADRQRIVDLLGEHHVDGRLTQGEFEERIQAAYTATTLGDLARLMRDLPRMQAPTEPTPEPHHRPDAPPTACSAHTGRGPFASWASTGAVVLVIWLVSSIVSGHLLYFWPAWVIGPWGAILAFRALGEFAARSAHRGDSAHTP